MSEIITSLRPVGADSETHKIQRGNLTPPLVCVSSAIRDASDPSGFRSSLMLKRDGLAFYRMTLLDPSLLLVIHNAPFDLAVACNEDPDLIFLIFDAFMAGRITCTIVVQKLIDIAFGHRKFRRNNGKVTKTGYGLDDLILLYYGEIVQKKDTWRTSYALLDDVPLHMWPFNAKAYAIKDSVEHLRLYEGQTRLIQTHFGGHLPNQLEQQRANWVLHLMSTWGIRADEKMVDYFVKHCEEEIQKMHQALLYCLHCGQPRKQHDATACIKFENTGIFKDDGSRTMKEIQRRVAAATMRRHITVPFEFVEVSGQKHPVPLEELVTLAKRCNVVLPMTDPSTKFPGGQIKTDKDTLEQTDDPHLHVLAESMTFAKHLGQWGPVLRAAVLRPVVCRYEVLVETGRTASSGSEGQEGTNIQNPPRKGDVRPAIVPRPGNLFCSTDADTIELRSHAQNCLELVGWSYMAERLIEQAKSRGPDLHEVLGAAIMGMDAIEFQKRRKEGDASVNDARQFAKIPNFGFPGGLGADTFVGFAAAQLSREAFNKWFSTNREEAVKKAKAIREVWFDTFPENRYYFEIVGNKIDRKKGYGTIQQLMSMRIRGETRFTAGANCVDYETEALTRRGWLRGTEITLDDEILTKNIETGELEWQKPIILNHYPEYEGPLVEFTSSTMSAVSTPNHRWMVSDKEGFTKCVTSEEISKNGDHKIHRTGELVVADAPYEDDLLRLIGWVLTDGSIHKSKKYNSSRITIYQSKLHTIPIIDELFERLNVGHKRQVRTASGRGELAQVQWHFSNKPIRAKKDVDLTGVRSTGVGKGGAKRKYTLQNYLDAGLGTDADEIVAKKLKVTHVAVRYMRKKHGVVAPTVQQFNSRGYAKLIRELFPDRLLTTDFVSQLSRRQAQILAETMFLGDGTKANEQEKFFTRSESAANAFQMLLMQAGFSSSSEWRDMSKYQPRSSKLANVPKMKGVWHVMKYTRTQSQIVKHQVKEYTAKKGVWCPTVPNTFFVARRDRKTFITGNTYFQGRVADAMKEILWRLSMECYTGRETTKEGLLNGRTSVLFGSRIVMFLHDEPICEHPEYNAWERAERQRTIVVETLSKWLPAIPCTSSAVLSRRWFKGAEPLYVDGKLVPVRPEKIVREDGSVKIKWVEDKLEAPPLLVAA